MSTVTSADGTVIDYDRYGDGPAVVFIGGAATYRAIDEATTQTAKRLAAEGFTTVDYDRRGRGRSGDTQPWALAREVEDVAALINVVGRAAALCTNSSGADVALAAASAGVGVTALALYEPPFFAGRGFTAHLAALRSLLADGKNDEAMRYNLTSVRRTECRSRSPRARPQRRWVFMPSGGQQPPRPARSRSWRVEGWRGALGGPFPAPARQTGHAVLPHPAYRCSSPGGIRSAPPVPKWSGRNDGSIEADQAQVIG
jgi:pimeloyl-ACP methyl ester carboxylesterase